MTVTSACVLSLIGGIWMAGQVQISLSFLLVAGLGSLITGGMLARRSHPLTMWLLAVACLLVGMVRGLQADTLPSDDISRFIGQNVAVYGVVDAAPEKSKIDDEQLSVRYRIRVEAVKTGPVPQAASGRLFASVRQPQDTPVFDYGKHIVIDGALKELHGYNNPGAPDMVASWRRQGFTARLISKAQPRYAEQSETGWQVKLHSLREAMITRMKLAMPDSDSSILQGALFGGYGGISRQVVQEYAATGIIHILSVSGSHIALVAGAVHWLGGVAGLRPQPTAILAGIGVVGYSLLAGLSPPVVRSVIMGLIALFAAVWGRERDAGNALALTAAGMLAFQPSLLNDISFQLSFGGTAGLVLFYTKTEAKLALLPRWLARPIAATTAAQLGVLPVMAWYFNTLPLISFATNLLVVPAIELVVVLGLAGCIAALAFPAAGHLLLVVCSLILGAANHINSLLALAPLSVYLPPLNLLAASIYYGALLWLYGYLPILPEVSYLLSRHLVKTTAVLAVVAVVASAIILWPRPMSVHFIDVGQGDATLVLTPKGRAVLIDTGGTASDEFDIGERVVLPYLRRLHVTQLDYLILTHGHQDHAGGAAALTAALPVKSLLLPPEERTAAIDKLLMRRQSAVIPAYGGQSLVLDGVRFSLLRPGAPSVLKRGRINETSCVVEVRYGSHSFLITGDLEGQSEQQILAQGLSPQTVLKVGHHGAKASTSPAFLAAVNPRFAVISVGAGNRYGHPHPDTVNRLSSGGRTVFRTDQHGAILFESDGSRLTAKPYIRQHGGRNE